MIPRATYRLQFNAQFGFRDAERIAPYLNQLGVSHIYASPWLKARAGSTHGYDVADYRKVNHELGTQADFLAMIDAFRASGLRTILDFVPNHVGIGGVDNPLWLDVLEWGPESTYAGWFDIDWRPPSSAWADKLLVPFLADQYGVELSRGQLQLRFDPKEGSFAVWAYNVHKLPICPQHYGRVLGDELPELERLGDDFASLADWRPQMGQRAAKLKAQLAELAAEREDIRNEIAIAVDRFAGVTDQDITWKALDSLIHDQYWRPANFRVAADDINYRRFFNVNDLAGVRMELSDLFDYAHELVFSWIANGTIDGLRIDHVDGLLNPQQYFERLRSHPSVANRTDHFYIVVEKILAPHETLRENWPIEGTTGYEFGAQVTELLIDHSGEEPLSQLYREWVEEPVEFPQMVRDAKLQIIRNEMASELGVLAREAAGVARQNPRTADFTHNVLRRAIREIIAIFPVYRTYLDEDNPPTVEDRRYLDWAVSQARMNEIELDSSVFDFVHALLSGDLVSQGRSGFSHHAVMRCAMKLQQFSGPVMAKGLEDTAFYRYNRFIALNEVGADPDQFGPPMSHFHRANMHRAKQWPHCMLTTSTHDTKRGEDVRARLAILSEIPQDWSAQVNSWSRILRARRGEIGSKAPPDRNDEYLIFQLLLGTWPPELTSTRDGLDPTVLGTYVERLKAAMIKGVREAKLHSTWKAPNTEYENAVQAFIDSALAVDSDAFYATFLPFQERVARLGVENSLVQLTLKLTAPGVPDIYQGSESWELSMMDPDNRRRVDYDSLRQLLACVNDRSAKELMQNWQNGAIKMLVTARLLALRKTEPDLFATGKYESITVSGSKADWICAFERQLESKSVMVAVARFPARRAADPDWGDTEIPVPTSLQGKVLRNTITGATISRKGTSLAPGELFDSLPVALLIADS